jgi:hypothetical protein
LRALAESNPRWGEPYYGLGLIEEYRSYHEGIDHSSLAIHWFDQFLALADREDHRWKEVDGRRARLEDIREGHNYKDKVSRYLERANEISGTATRLFPTGLTLESLRGDAVLGDLVKAKGDGFYLEYAHDLVGGEEVHPEVFAFGGLVGVYRLSLAFDANHPDGAQAIDRIGFSSWGVMWIPRAGIYVRLGAPRPIQCGSLSLRPSVISSGAFAFSPKGFHQPSEELKAVRLDFKAWSAGFDYTVGAALDLKLAPNVLIGTRIEYTFTDYELEVSSGQRSGRYSMDLPKWRLAITVIGRI